MAYKHYNDSKARCPVCHDSGVAIQLKSDVMRYKPPADGYKGTTKPKDKHKPQDTDSGDPGELIVYELHARCFCNAGMARNDLVGWPIASRADFPDAPASLFDNAVNVAVDESAKEGWWHK